MSKFDDELKLALRREEPSPDFTNRLMARIAQLPAAEAPPVQLEKLRETGRLGAQGTGRLGDWWQRIISVFQVPKLGWAMAGAIAVILFGGIFGMMQYREHQLELRRQAELAEQAEGERAKEQVMLAMRIASAKLNVAQKKVQETSERVTEEERSAR
jgi:hypothetical protein